ncbi:MAG: hypothetical protein WBQ16_08090 [Nitrososphaeraceae archaeon]
MHYTVFVKFNPNGKIEVKGNEITICLRSKPERGKANKEMIERLVAILRYLRIKYVLFQD